MKSRTLRVSFIPNALPGERTRALYNPPRPSGSEILYGQRRRPSPFLLSAHKILLYYHAVVVYIYIYYLLYTRYYYINDDRRTQCAFN